MCVFIDVSPNTPSHIDIRRRAARPWWTPWLTANIIDFLTPTHTHTYTSTHTHIHTRVHTHTLTQRRLVPVDNEFCVDVSVHSFSLVAFL